MHYLYELYPDTVLALGYAYLEEMKNRKVIKCRRMMEIFQSIMPEWDFDFDDDNKTCILLDDDSEPILKKQTSQLEFMKSCIRYVMKQARHIKNEVDLFWAKDIDALECEKVISQYIQKFSKYYGTVRVACVDNNVYVIPIHHIDNINFNVVPLTNHKTGNTQYIVYFFNTRFKKWMYADVYNDEQKANDVCLAYNS